LHASVPELVDAGSIGTRGLFLIGSTSLNLHFANPLTAMAIALGQDPACASECHVGVARVEMDKNEIYIPVLLFQISWLELLVVEQNFQVKELVLN